MEKKREVGGERHQQKQRDRKGERKKIMGKKREQEESRSERAQ